MAIPKLVIGEYILLGEGLRDARFLKELCNARGIDGYTISDVEGNQNFGNYIEAISAQSGFKQTCKSILILSDNDESPIASFALIKEQLNSIGFPSPPRPLEIAKKKDLPSVGILMLPFPDISGNSLGCLETLLIPAMQAANPNEAACVDRLMACIDAGSWEKKGSQDKLKVRCLISSVYKDDPMHGLNHCFSPHKNLIPLGHQIFDPIAELLRYFAAWSESNTAKWTDWKAANCP